MLLAASHHYTKQSCQNCDASPIEKQNAVLCTDL
jgi:hypothetical protein